MQTINKELKKVFIKQKVLFWIIAFLLVKAVGLYFFDIDAEDVGDQVTYEFYQEKLGGKLEQEKEDFIVVRYEKLNAVSENINNLEEMYENGTITQNDYLNELDEILQIKQEQDIINQFYSKYQYAIKDRDRHYIINDYGWSKLLTEESMDFLLVALLFIIVIPVFCLEYETKMVHVLLCSKNGRTKLAVVKVLMMCLIAATCSFLSNLIEYFYYKLFYGLGYGNAPVQSLTFFEESGLSLTLNQMWCLVILIRIVGAIYLCILIMAISIIVRSSLLSIFINTVLTIIPVYMPNSSRLKYMIPLPSGLLYGIGFLFPNCYDYRLSEEDVSMKVEKYISFREFDRIELLFIAVIVFIMIGFLVYLIMKKYSGSKVSVTFKSRKKIFLLIAFLFSACLSACSMEQDVFEEEFYENSYSSNIQLTNQYCFTSDGVDIKGTDIQTGENFSILRDVFEQSSNKEVSVSIFATNKYLYYSKDYENEFRIYRVDLTDFSEKWIYSMGHSTLLNGANTECQYNLVLVSQKYYFIYESVNKNYYYIDRKTEEKRIIGSNSNLTLGDYGNKIYYQNTVGYLIEYDIDTEAETIMNDIHLRSPYSVKGSSYYICGSYCYYTNMLDSDYLYRYCFETRDNELLIKKKVSSFCADNYYFYYIDSEQENKLCRLDLTSLKTDVLLTGSYEGIELSPDKTVLYVKSDEFWEALDLAAVDKSI